MKFGVVGGDHDLKKYQSILEADSPVDLFVFEILLQPTWGLPSQVVPCLLILDEKGLLTNLHGSRSVGTEKEFMEEAKHILKTTLDCQLGFRYSGFWKNPFVRTEAYRDEVLLASENNCPLQISNVPKKFRDSLSRLVGQQADVLALGQTSSDILGLLVDVAYETNNDKPFVVCLTGSYGGGRGLLRYICPYSLDPDQDENSNKLHENYPNTIFLDRVEPWIYSPELKDVLALGCGELTVNEAFVCNEIRRLAKSGKVTILVLDLIRSDMSVALSGRFVRSVQRLARRYKFFIAVDETITGLTTGKAFSFQHIKDFVPDLFITGKAFGVCALVSLNKNVKPPCDPFFLTSELKGNNLVYTQFLIDHILDTKAHITLDGVGRKLRVLMRKAGYECRGIGGNIYCKEIPVDKRLISTNDRLFLPLDCDPNIIKKVMTFFPKRKGIKRSRQLLP
jgi:hypothetical protein